MGQGMEYYVECISGLSDVFQDEIRLKIYDSHQIKELHIVDASASIKSIRPSINHQSKYARNINIAMPQGTSKYISQMH